MSVSFVDCHAELLPSLRAFMARVYRPEYILCNDEKLFNWQFGNGTNGKGSSCLKLARLEDEIVGCLGYIPVDFSLGGQILLGAWMVNWMVDPDQRRLGLGPLLMREVTSQFDVALNIGPNSDARGLLARMGWTDFGELARYICVLDVEAAGQLTRSGELQWPAIATCEKRQPPKEIITSLVDRFRDDAFSVATVSETISATHSSVRDLLSDRKSFTRGGQTSQRSCATKNNVRLMFQAAAPGVEQLLPDGIEWSNVSIHGKATTRRFHLHVREQRIDSEC